jgi:purine-binding chemotaxis protein CheW
MTTPSAPSIEARVEELERRLLSLRRELQPEVEPIPRAPFDALEVRIDEHLYLIPVDPVRLVLPIMWPTPLPDAPDWVRGTFRYGETLVPLVDLALRLHGTRNPIQPDDVVILIEHPTWRGLHVSGVGDVMRVEPDRLTPPAPGIPQAPFLVASCALGETASTHLLSIARLSREITLDDE